MTIEEEFMSDGYINKELLDELIRRAGGDIFDVGYDSNFIDENMRLTDDGRRMLVEDDKKASMRQLIMDEVSSRMAAADYLGLPLFVLDMKIWELYNEWYPEYVEGEEQEYKDWLSTYGDTEIGRAYAKKQERQENCWTQNFGTEHGWNVLSEEETMELISYGLAVEESGGPEVEDTPKRHLKLIISEDN